MCLEHMGEKALLIKYLETFFQRNGIDDVDEFLSKQYPHELHSSKGKTYVLFLIKLFDVFFKFFFTLKWTLKSNIV